LGPRLGYPDPDRRIGTQIELRRHDADAPQRRDAEQRKHGADHATFGAGATCSPAAA
jgi:hypothetical protein